MGPIFHRDFLLFDKDLEENDISQSSKTEDEDVGSEAPGELDVDLSSWHEVSDDKLGESLETGDAHPHEDGDEVVPPVGVA